MKLKIKSQPEDFQVEELSVLPLKKKGPFGVYILKKKGWNTIDALYEIAKAFKISFKGVAYGGRKDRHALTSQYITIGGPRHDNIQGKNYSTEFVGSMGRPMGPDLIEGNKFEITVRNLSEAQAHVAARESETVKSFGCPNYFDDQRFGSFDPVQGFLVENSCSDILTVRTVRLRNR